MTFDRSYEMNVWRTRNNLLEYTKQPPKLSLCQITPAPSFWIQKLVSFLDSQNDPAKVVQDYDGIQLLRRELSTVLPTPLMSHASGQFDDHVVNAFCFPVTRNAKLNFNAVRLSPSSLAMFDTQQLQGWRRNMASRTVDCFRETSCRSPGSLEEWLAAFRNIHRLMRIPSKRKRTHHPSLTWHTCY